MKIISVMVMIIGLVWGMQNAQAENWQLIGGNNDNLVYVDTESIKKDESGFIKVWSALRYKDGSGSELMHFIFSPAKNFTLQGSVYFDGQGNLIEGGSYSSPKWEPVEDRTYPSVVYSYVTKK